MHIRMTIPQPPFPMMTRVAPMTGWYASIRHQIQFWRMREQQRREQRQLDRAWRIRLQEERWLRLSEMSDDRVIGLMKRSWGPVDPG